MHIGEINNNCQVFSHILEGFFSAVLSHCKTSRTGQLDRLMYCSSKWQRSQWTARRRRDGAALRFRFHSRDGRIVVRVRSNCACALVGQKAGFHDATASQACIVIRRLKTRLSHIRAHVSHAVSPVQAPASRMLSEHFKRLHFYKIYPFLYKHGILWRFHKKLC